MVATATPEIQSIAPELLLECLDPRHRAQIAGCMEHPENHLLVIYSCAEEQRYQVREVGPSRACATLEQAIRATPAGFSTRYVTRCFAAPESLRLPGIPAAPSVPYALAKLTITPDPAGEKTAEKAGAPAPERARIRLPEPDRVAPAAPAPAPTIPPTPAAPTSTLQVAQGIQQLRRTLETRDAELRRRENQLTEQLAALAEREAALAAATEVNTARGEELDALRKSLHDKENLLTAAERDLASRRTAADTREAELAKRQTQLALREEAVSERESDADAAEEELTARRDTLDAREAELRKRHAVAVARENALAEREAADAAAARELQERNEALEKEIAGLLALLKEFSGE